MLTTFVIVGGGPTGVELAGAIAEIARQSLTPRVPYPRHHDHARVLLLEGADRVLPTFPPELSEKAKRQLETLGVEVRTGARVTRIEHDAVWIGPERIPSRTVSWAAGVQASPLGRMLGVPVDGAGRVVVERDCSVPGHPETFVVGDLAHMERGDGLVPGVAQAASSRAGMRPT